MGRLGRRPHRRRRTVEGYATRGAAAQTAPNVVLVAARAETIPLARWCADVVWLSPVVHHIADLPAAAAEIHCVLAPEGGLLVRNLFADLGTTPWLNELPGADRACHVFPTVRELARLFHPHNLELIATVEVAERYRRRSAKAAGAWIRSVRNADTLLLAFTDDEIPAGLERLHSHPPTTPSSRHGSVWPPFVPPADLAGPNYAHAR